MNYVKRSRNLKPTYDSVVNGEGSIKKRPAPISMRFNEVQLAKLKPHAGDQSLGVYCRDFILKGHNIESGGKKPKLFPDQIVKAQILREIGLAGISENLQSIKNKLEAVGLDEVDPLLPDISQTCADVAAMRSTLIKSLGVHNRRGPCS